MTMSHNASETAKNGQKQNFPTISQTNTNVICKLNMLVLVLFIIIIGLNNYKLALNQANGRVE